MPARPSALMILTAAALLLAAGCRPAPTTAPPSPTHPPASRTARPSATAARFTLPTSAPSRTPFPTDAPLPPAPTPGLPPSPTAQPALSAHRWKPEPVLVWLSLNRGTEGAEPGNAPQLVLYGSGHVIVQRCEDGRCGLESAQLKRGEVCSLLNRIDQEGFLDYDPAGYRSPQGGETALIEVNAWKQVRAELDRLRQWLEDPGWLDRQQNCDRCVPRPEIPPAVRDTVAFLQGYVPPNAQPYQAERLAVWLSEPYVEGRPTPWGLSDLTLSSLDERSRCSTGERGVVVLEGEEARRAAGELSRPVVSGGVPVFTEGGLALQAVGRWLIPGEGVEACGETVTVPVPAPLAEMSCSPDDGLAAVLGP